jgi:leader peptidase (prepilin peptidase)/N-methyltransferase
MTIGAVLLGAIVGSFLNVCIHRLPRGLSIVRPRSACPGCGRGIAWYDNVPLLSYLALRGRCRGCGASIAKRYPLVEAATALLFGLLWRSNGPTPRFLVEAAFGAALIALILIDAEHLLLPDAITLPGIALGLLAAPAVARFDPARGLTPFAAFLASLQAAALGYAIPWSINAAYRGWQRLRAVPAAEREDGIGQGDFKLLAMIGAFLGTPVLLFVLFSGSVAGALYGLLMMAWRGDGWKAKLPFGVFLGGAAIVALFVGPASVAWYLGFLGAQP